MPRLRLLPLLVAALLLTLAAGARADTPKPGALYHDGPTGRYLLAGPWVFSHSRTGAGRVVTVPYAWNATDASTASFRGGIGYYRKTFTLPTSAANLSWIVRFESVNYRATVSLYGHEIARHAGSYLP